MHNINKKIEHRINSTHAVSTKKFGPTLWDSLFYMILGAYPSKLNINNKEHIKIKNSFINTFCNLRYILPCSYCRLSYKLFYKELPIEPYTKSKISMMYWLYLLKDKINKKLIKQELDFYTELHNKYKSKKISKEEYIKIVKGCFKTVPSPSFNDILARYSVHKGICNEKMKKCV